MFRRDLLLAFFWCILFQGCPGIEARGQAPRLPSSEDALPRAVRARNLAEVERLINSGANVNTPDAAGAAPLLDAVWLSDVETAGLLLKHGADPNVKDSSEEAVSALQYAVISGKAELVKLLLTAGAQVNRRSHAGQSMLHLAAARGFQPVAQLLLEAGADLTALDANGHTALDSAILHNQTAAALWLISRGANVTRMHPADGRGALHEACIKGAAALIQPLVNAGASLAQRDRFGQTPLDLALDYKNEKTVASILRLSSGVKEASATADEAMEAAVVRGQTEIVRLLLDAGFDINRPTAAGSSYLNDAALKGQAKVVQLLLSRGAAVESRNAQGGTPLHDAALAGSTEVLALLLNHGARIDARDMESEATPLMLAASLGKANAIALLLQRGAAAGLRDKHGHTALERARETESSDAIRLLVEASTPAVGRSPHGH